MRPLNTVSRNAASVCSDITNSTTNPGGTDNIIESQRPDRGRSNVNGADDSRDNATTELDLQYEIYDNEEMFYIYLHFCMSNIILKTKWKHNKIEEDRKWKEFLQQISRLRKK